MSTLSTIKQSPTFTKELVADPNREVISRQVRDAHFSYVKPIAFDNPKLVHFSADLLTDLGVEVDDEELFLAAMSGNKLLDDFESYAMCYGGHQFGQWAGQLGDGRAINVFESKFKNGLQTLQLKGAGPTTYSRRADGFAVLRSSVREYLCSEAMYHLGVPTTRALSLVKSGELVTRDLLYDGNPKDEQGAVVCRVAPTFIRFGSFEILTARKDVKNLKKLADYTIKHFYPSFIDNDNKYLDFYKAVVIKTKDLIIDWMRVGFVHGVMNTDNLSILGLTIDYGPYGWLEDYDPTWTPNITDAQGRRYRFENQPNIALWNLMQLANALYPLIKDVAVLEAELERFKKEYLEDYNSMMLSKIGVFDSKNKHLIPELETLMFRSSLDYILFFRELSKNKELTPQAFVEILEMTSYLEKHELQEDIEKWKKWFSKYQEVLGKEKLSTEERSKKMKAINPKYVLRNYMAQLAIEASEKGDNSIIEELYQLLLNPYGEQPTMEKWYKKRPDWAKNKPGCSMLSCSS